MKIVVIGTRGIPNIMGGVETHCEELFPRLASKGFDISLIRRSKYVNAEVDEKSGVSEHIWKGVKLYDIPAPETKTFEAIVHTIRALFKAKSLGADIVHIHAVGPALVTPLAKILGLKVVFTHHGADYNRDKWGQIAKFALRMGERFACKWADHIIVISDVIKQIIADNCHRTENVHLIYNGVPKAEFCHELLYFRTLGIEEGKYILGMCRFVPEKHLHDLVSAYVQLKNDNRIPKDVKLVLAGDTDFEDEYSFNLKKSAKENNVVLTGFVRGTKLHSLLTNAMCYCLPSSHEGLPIALLEAMSYKLPVFTSSIPANLEVALDKERYFEVGDVNALADKLESVCNAPLQRIDYDMYKYKWGRIADQVAEIYKSFEI